MPEAPEPTPYLLRDSAGWIRLALAVGILVAFVALVFPREGQSYESNPFAGPLWGTGSGVPAAERSVWLALTVCLLAAMGAGIVWPRWHTGIVSAIGCAAWFGLSLLAIAMSAI